MLPFSSMLAPRAFALLLSARFAAVAAGIFFFSLLLVLSFPVGLTFDEAFNANVALSLAQGKGYATHVGGPAVAFNPIITTGSLFIAPLSILLQLFKPSNLLVHLYSLTITFLFFSITLSLSARIHRYLPALLVIFSVLFTPQGKTDLVPNSEVASLPEPPYGLWFQFLGNMSGTWALIAAIFACVSVSNSRWKSWLTVFLCSAFACNAKMVHALPLMSAFFTMLIYAPRKAFPSIAAGVFGVYVGVRIDSWLARATLAPGEADNLRLIAVNFFKSNQRVYSDFLHSPSTQGLRNILRNVAENMLDGVLYVGPYLVCVAIGATAAAAFLIVKNGRLRNLSEGEGVLVACAVASVVVLLWWSGIPDAPTRFLTSAAPLLVTTAAIATLSAIKIQVPAARYLLLSIFATAGVCSLWQTIFTTLANTPQLRTASNDQHTVVNWLRSAASRHHRKPLCGDSWWHPHEIAFLSGTPETVSCDYDRAHAMVIPKHIFPNGTPPQRADTRCTLKLSGAYYDLLLCRKRPVANQ